MERYIVITLSNGYCGCDKTEYVIFPEGTTDSEIEAYIEDEIVDYAESYSCMATGWEGDFESEEDEETYYDNINSNWREVTKEEIETEEFLPV